MSMEHSKELMNLAADNIRILAASMVERAKSGHPGGAMGGADFINVLYSEFLNFDPDEATWRCRDRFFNLNQLTGKTFHIGYRLLTIASLQNIQRPVFTFL